MIYKLIFIILTFSDGIYSWLCLSSGRLLGLWLLGGAGLGGGNLGGAGFGGRCFAPPECVLCSNKEMEHARNSMIALFD